MNEASMANTEKKNKMIKLVKSNLKNIMVDKIQVISEKDIRIHEQVIDPYNKVLIKNREDASFIEIDPNLLINYHDLSKELN